MELGQLEIFIAVAESGSFTAGAKKLYISHSTTSRAVSALENELGLTLIERGRGKFSLTAPGEILLSQGKRLLEEAESLKQRLKEINN